MEALSTEAIASTVPCIPSMILPRTYQRNTASCQSDEKDERTAGRSDVSALSRDAGVGMKKPVACAAGSFLVQVAIRLSFG